mgnify:FL=1|jgi:uncharacterized protein
MKWSLQQLHKYNGKTFTFSTTFNFEEEIKPIDDILSISIVYVEGQGRNLFDDDFHFDLHIKANLILEDARTLEPIDFSIDLEVEETFSADPDNLNAQFIEKNTIDLRAVVWENILLEKPIRIVKEDTTDN